MEGSRDLPTVMHNSKILYPAHTAPHPILWPIFAMQYLLLTIPAILATAVMLTDQLEVGEIPEVRAEIFSLGLFTSGVATVIQILVGARLPILEGMNSIYIISIAAIIRSSHMDNETLFTDTPGNTTTGPQLWRLKMAELQGNLLLSSGTHFLLGATGMIGFLLHFIGPVTLAPTVALVGISISGQMIPLCQQHWGIAVLVYTGKVIDTFAQGREEDKLSSLRN